jgi:hypothetical protein
MQQETDRQTDRQRELETAATLLSSHSLLQHASLLKDTNIATHYRFHQHHEFKSLYVVPQKLKLFLLQKQYYSFLALFNKQSYTNKPNARYVIKKVPLKI